MRWSERRTAVRSTFEMTSTLSFRATRALVRRRSSCSRSMTTPEMDQFAETTRRVMKRETYGTYIRQRISRALSHHGSR